MILATCHPDKKHKAKGLCAACYMKSRTPPRNMPKYNRLVINGIKNVPCMDCGNRYPPECMDFDHRPDAGEKCFEIANKLHNLRIGSLLAEISKCDVVCSNCHRIRTIKRKIEGS